MLTSNVSIHGLSTFLGTEKNVPKYFWFLVFGVSATFSAIYIWSVAADYLKHETVHVNELNSGSLPFPTITICNLNAYRKSALPLVSGAMVLMEAYRQIIDELVDKRKTDTESKSSFIKGKKDANSRQKRTVCPAGYDLAGDSCYKHLYIKKTHDEVEHECQADNAKAHLPAIPDQANYDEFQTWLNSSYVYGSVFVEWSDQLEEGTWTVQDQLTGSSCPMPFQKWSSGNPNNNAEYENCIAIKSRSDMNDVDCDWPLSVVCQVPLFNNLCPRTGCDPPTNITNGNISTASQILVGANVTYMCNEGFHLNGQSVLTCQSNLAYDYMEPDCKKMCPIPIDVPHATIHISDEVIVGGVAIRYLCDSGYRLVGESNRTCTDDGYYDIINSPSCEGLCPEIQKTNWMHVVYSGNPIVKGVTAAIFCDSNYNFLGETLLTCGSDGTWDWPVGFCEACPNEWIWKLRACYRALGNTSNHDDAISGCQNLNKRNELPIFRHDADWDHFIEAVSEVDIGSYRLWIAGGDLANEGTFVIQDGTNGNICPMRFTKWRPFQPNNVRDHSRDYDQECICKDDYNSATMNDWWCFEKDLRTVCQIRYFPYCEGCEPPRSINNGNFSATPWMPVGGVATYVCEPGYILDGQSVLTCQSNLKYDFVEPNCKSNN